MQTSPRYEPHGHLPRLPARLESWFGRLPRTLPVVSILPVLNRVFAEAVRDGELDFLAETSVAIEVTDIAVVLPLTLRQGKLCQAGTASTPAIRIQGVLYAYLLLVAQVEDPDTLFFRRQLRVEGDTELGLRVKNFLAAFEPGDRLLSLQGFLRRRIQELRSIRF